VPPSSQRPPSGDSSVDPMVSDSTSGSRGSRGPSGSRSGADRGRRASEALVSGRYQVVANLGEGGMGTISLARDTELDRLVALKRLTASFPSQKKRARFEAEALASARLQHPNVIKTHELIWSPRDLCLVMEYVEGESLAERLEEGPLGTEEVLQIAKGMAAGLAHAHSQSVIHRDLKPDNVMLADDGRILLIDFGLAKRIDTSQALTKTGQFIGTPTYVPPEQITEGKHADARADVYGFGACLYHMLCGQPPFLCESLAQLVSTILTTPPESPSKVAQGVDPGLAKLCLRCLEKSPADRFASAGDLLEALERVGERQGASSPGPWILLGLAVVLLIGAAAVAVSDPDLGPLPQAPSVTLASTPAATRDPLEPGRLVLRPERSFSVPGERYGNPEYCALSVTPNGRVLVALRSNPYQLTRWDPATARMEASWTVGIDRVAMTARGDLAAVIGGSTLSFFPSDHDPVQLQAPRLKRLEPEGWFPGWTTCTLAFSPDGKSLAVASQAGGFAILDVASGRIVQQFATDRYFRDCVFTEGLLLATHDGGRRGAGGARLWSLVSGRELGRLKFSMAARLALLPDGRVAFGGKTRHLGVLRPHPKGISDVEFLDPSGAPPRAAGPNERPLAHRLQVLSLAASAGSLYSGAGTEAEGELRRWSAQSLRLLEVVQLPNAPIAIAPHEKGVFVLTYEGVVHALEFVE
jgi:predicted Ser/Thr protein kinase